MVFANENCKLIRFNFGIGTANYTSFCIVDYDTYCKFLSGLSRIYGLLMANKPIYFSIGGIFSICFTDVETLKYCIEVCNVDELQIQVLKDLHIDIDNIGRDFVNTVISFI